MKKITVVKGKIGKIKISNTTLPLFEINTTKGVTTALVDASEVLGVDYKRVTIDVEHYRL